MVKRCYCSMAGTDACRECVYNGDGVKPPKPAYTPRVKYGDTPYSRRLLQAEEAIRDLEDRIAALEMGK